MLYTFRRTTSLLLSRARSVYLCGVKPTVMCSSLPKAPVPALEHSMRRYLDFVRPYLSEDQFAKTTETVQQFLHFPGPELQHLLEKHAEEVTNWVTCQIYDDMLREREPIPINWNSCSVNLSEDFNGLDSQLRFAAKLTKHFLCTKEAMEKGIWTDPHIRKGKHETGTVSQAFSSCRLPRRHKDITVQYPAKDGAIRHINVIHNNQIFSLDVYGENGKRLSTDQIYAQLKTVVEESERPELPMGLLTTLHRDSWADARADLMLDERNKEILENIQRSFFVLCLDKPMDVSCIQGFSKIVNTDAAYAYIEGRTLDVIQLFYGGGVDLNTANRWFDKGLQVIVGTNGTWGLNQEHTLLDGAELQTLYYTLKKSFEDTNVDTDMEGIPSSQLAPPRKLLLNMNDKTKSAVREARQSITELISNTDTMDSTFTKFGKQALKDAGIRPNSFMQVALQLAFHRLHQQLPMSEEHVGISTFKMGRTDTMKCYNSQAHAFIQLMDDTSVSDSEKLKLLNQAADSHNLLIKEAIQGRGFRAHLEGLEKTAVKFGYDVPGIFLDSAYTLCSSGNLVGTQVFGPRDARGCFSPSPGGYACWYSIQDNAIFMVVTALCGLYRTDAVQFFHTLSQSLQDMHALLAFSS